MRDEGDWEGWLSFFLRGVAEVSAQATETAGRILALRELHRSRITDRFGRAAGHGHRVLEVLYRRPIVAVEDVRMLTGTTYPAANQLVKRFVEQKMLREITGHARHRRFRYDPYVRLFTDEEEVSPTRPGTS